MDFSYFHPIWQTVLIVSAGSDPTSPAAFQRLGSEPGRLLNSGFTTLLKGSLLCFAHTFIILSAFQAKK